MPYNSEDVKSELKKKYKKLKTAAEFLGVNPSTLTRLIEVGSEDFKDRLKNIGITVGDSFTQNNSSDNMGNHQNKADTINHHHATPGVSENTLMRMLDSQEDTIKWLKQKLDEKDVSIHMLREMLIAKEKQIERFEQKSGDNIIILFNKLDEIYHACMLMKDVHAEVKESLAEHKDKTWKDLETIKRQHIKKKKKRIVVSKK